MQFGQSTARLVAAANSVNATNVTDGLTKVVGITGYNGATASYLKLYDKATAPDQNDTPRQTFYLPASLPFRFSFENPISFTKGLGYRLTLNGADNDNNAVAANAVLGLNIDYC